ncbi:MAG: nucleotidyltransferase substrate binding protein [Gammaproteobacteria bacterium]
MKTLNTEYASKSIKILETSYQMLLSSQKGTVEYEIYRHSTIKCFEVTLELIGKLLRKTIKPYFPSPKAVDKLNYKDVFRHAFKHGLVDEALLNRWFAYRDNRNDTAHDYGESFAEETVILLKDFVEDAKKIVSILES